MTMSNLFLHSFRTDLFNIDILELIGKTEEWLIQEIRLLGVDDVQQIFYCSFENGELKFQMKEEYQ